MVEECIFCFKHLYAFPGLLTAIFLFVFEAEWEESESVAFKGKKRMYHLSGKMI